MVSRDVTITNNIGLHARPATFFVQKANTYRSVIKIEKDDRTVSARVCSGSHSELPKNDHNFACRRADEEEAIDGLAALFDGFTMIISINKTGGRAMLRCFNTCEPGTIIFSQQHRRTK